MANGDREDEDRAWIDRMLDLYPAEGPFRARPTHNEVVHVGHGWYMRAARSAVAAIRLSDMGLGDVAAPNRRCLLEHAIALKWLAKEGNPLVDTIKNGHRYTTAKIDQAIEEAGWTTVDRSAATDALAEPEPTKEQRRADRFLTFTARVEEYGERNDVPPYLAETGRSHPRGNRRPATSIQRPCSSLTPRKSRSTHRRRASSTWRWPWMRSISSSMATRGKTSSRN